jgi:dolichol-phosphate mannosyltransferase
MKQTRYILILPTYNEAKNIKSALNAVFANIPKSKKYYFGVLVADDTSPDGTGNIVRGLIKKNKDINLVSLKDKAGLGPAYYNAMKYAFGELKADYVFEFDADLSHDPTKLKDFINKIDDGYDFIVGTRYRGGGSIPNDWGIYRKILSKWGNMFIRVLFLNNAISDWTGGFKLLPKDLFYAVGKKPFMKKGYAFQIAVNKKALDLGYRVAEVPFDFKDRQKGKSKLSAYFTFYTLWYVVLTRFQDFMKSSFFKVCLVGAVGAIIQISTYPLFRNFMPVSIAHNLSILLAIISNFTLNNVFSFKDRQIDGFINLLRKFFSFLLVSMGSVVIQNIVMHLGLRVFNDTTKTENILNVLGIIVGLVFNYTFYVKLIWKKKK